MCESLDDVRGAYNTLAQELSSWVEFVANIDKLEIELRSREQFIQELAWLQRLESRGPSQQERLDTLLAGADADERCLNELRNKLQEHEEFTKRLLAAERVLFHFAKTNGIDAAPIARLLLRRDQDAIEDVIEVLHRIDAALVRPRAKRTGRPRKEEKDSATKVIAALCKHHGYENGSVMNEQPATNRGLKKDFGLGGNALSRFLDSQGGSKAYHAACKQGRIGMLLRKWNHELPDWNYQLRDHDGSNSPSARFQVNDE